MPASQRNFDLAQAKADAFILRSKDLADYVGPIDMETMLETYEGYFERFADKAGDDFESYINQGEDLITIPLTAHPTFFKSKEEIGLLSKLFTARAEGKTDQVSELEAQVKDIQTRHPYQDPTTDEEGELLYDAAKNTINPGQLMQLAMLNVAKKRYPKQWQQGHYSPFNRAIWHKYDRDGRVIPANV